MEELVIGIALLSYLISYFLLGLCYKFVEKYQVRQADREKGLYLRKLIILLVFVIPSLMFAVPLFICIVSFPMLIVGIIECYINMTTPFIINQVAAYIIIISSMLFLFTGINIVYNSVFKNSDSTLYKIHHTTFRYFYEGEGLCYKTAIYTFWFMILTRIVLPLFILTFILSILTI